MEHLLRLKLLIKSKIQRNRIRGLWKPCISSSLLYPMYQIQSASFGASSLVGSGPRSLPTTARPVALLQPSFWVLCPLKPGVQMWMKQIWSISGEPQLKCCATKFVDWPDVKMLGCTMSRSIVSSKPVSTLEKDPVEKQPTENRKNLQLGLTGSWWRRIATGQRGGEFIMPWGLREGEAVNNWMNCVVDGLFLSLWMIWMAQVLSSWCFSLVKPFSK